MKRIYLKLTVIIVVFLTFMIGAHAQNETYTFESFDKVIISPYIEVEFRQADEESVEIIENKEPGKFNMELKNRTLHLYLEGAKITSPTEKIKMNDYKKKVPIYKGTMAKVIVRYKHVNVFALRGEERFDFTSLIEQNKIEFRIYGESEVYLNKINLNDLRVTIYGESYMEIKEGKTKSQKFTAYGESRVNALQIENKQTKLTAYGEGDYQFNVFDRLKVTAYGEAKVRYQGDAELKKGIIIGDASIRRL
ncbi:GIN domain-containing protein [Psychroserpens sp. MEBiC05023]